MELGIGIGWRPEIADTVEGLPGIDWVEVVAENICPGHPPASLARLRSRGVRVVPHGVSLGLGGADRPSGQRLADLAERAESLDAPLVTEHIAFVRAGGALTASPVLEAGHLLPVPRTWDALKVLCENVRIAQDSLPVPLALENIAALISWPNEQLTEGQFLAELVERTGVRLLIDVANLHTNHVNRGEDPSKALDELPVESIAYVHVAGGIEREGVWHDTHAHPVTPPVLDILADLRGRVRPPGVLLERDDHFPPAAELEAELTAIRTTLSAARHPVLGAPTGAAPETDAPVHAPAATRTCATTPAARTAAREPAVTQPEHTTTGAPAARTAAREPAVTQPEHTTTGAPAARTAAREPAVTQPEHTTTGAPAAGPSAGTPAARATTGTPQSTPAQDTDTPAGSPPDDTARARTGTPQSTPARNTDAPAGSRASDEAPRPVPAAPRAARERVALAQAALLSALVAGTPVPEGFDPRRLRVQSRALAGKRADVVGKVAPELPEILGTGYRAAFLAYAKTRPLRAGYRRDALDFAGHLLAAGRPDDLDARRRLSRWWRERATPHPRRRTTRLVLAARAALVRR